MYVVHIGGDVGFRDERDLLLKALGEAQAGTRTVLHDLRPTSGKNLLATMELNYADVVEITSRARGPHYKNKGRHHIHKCAVVHELKNVPWQGLDWYIKWYFIEPDLCFISVHPKEET